MKPGINHRIDWYVVRTASQAEYKTSHKLRQLGYSVYLPTMRVEVKNKRTHVYNTRERVLLPGYLFLGTLRSLYHAAKCEGVIGILSNEYRGEPVKVAASAVEAIYLAEINMQFDETRAARIHRKEEAKTKRLTVAMRFVKGHTGTVATGPLAGFSGIVENVTHQGQVELLLELFGRLTLASFDPLDLEDGEKFPKAS